MNYNPADDYDRYLMRQEAQDEWDYKHAYCEWCCNASDVDEDDFPLEENDQLWCERNEIIVRCKDHPCEHDCEWYNYF